MKTPEEDWKNIADQASNIAYRKACAQMKNLWELDAAKNEMLRILNGYKSECLYFDRPMNMLPEKERVFSATWKALSRAKPILEACCFLKVRKDGQL